MPRNNGALAIARAELHGADAPRAWELPVPLDAGVKVEPFPVAVLPPPLRQLVAEVAAATNSPADYVGVPALAIAAGALGAARMVDVKDGYPESASTYACVVAPKGSGKSPALSYLMEPVVAEQVRRRRDDKKSPPAFVDDVTVEKLADLMQKSARGVLMVRDELTALLAGFNQYKAKGQGADRQFYLKAHSGSAVSVLRKDPDADPVFIPHPALSIAGGIQPRVLARYTVDADDGLYDRFLFAYPDPLPMKPEDGLTVRPDLRSCWATALASIRALTFVTEAGANAEPGEDGARPYFLKLDAEAWGEWVGWTHWLSAEVNSEDFPESLRGPAAKMRGYAARLALVYHVLHDAYADQERRTLTGDSMAAGATLARYFFSHARRVWTHIGRDDRIAQARRILAWAQGRREPTFSRRDAWRYLGRLFDKIEDLQPPLRFLVQLGWIRYAPTEYEPGPGRLPSALFELHPSLLTVDKIDKNPVPTELH